jgi:hypothetical protein
MHKKKYYSLIVLIPSFNELHNLKKFLIKLNKNYKVLVIDDCSQDSTSSWLRKNKISFLKNKHNIGYEKSLIKGFKYIIKNNNTKTIITMDADGQHNFYNIKKFIKIYKKNKCDLVIGSREKKNRKIEEIISKLFYSKFKLKDPLTGFKLYNFDKIKKIDFDKIKKLFLVDLLIEFIKSGYKVKSFTISTKNRTDNPKIGGFVKVNLKMVYIFINILFKTNI